MTKEEKIRFRGEMETQAHVSAPVVRPVPEKTPEELAAIAYLDGLRTCAGEKMPVGLPLACIVKVVGYEEIPKASVTYTAHKNGSLCDSDWTVNGETKNDTSRIVFNRSWWDVPSWFIPSMDTPKPGVYNINAQDAIYVVSSFHTHTPVIYRTRGRKSGPSGADCRHSISNNVAGAVYDYAIRNIPAGYPKLSATMIYSSGSKRNINAE